MEATMPGKLEQVLSRVDAPTLMNWIGSDAGELVQLLDRRLESPAMLSKLVLSLRTAAGLLDDEISRRDLLDVLRPAEARSLLEFIADNSRTVIDAYTALRAVDFRRPAARNALFAFLEVVVPVPSIVAMPPATSMCTPDYQLFPHQIEALTRTRLALEGELGCALLHMPTGAGKTRTAMNLVADYLRERNRRVVVWLAHSEELCEQAVREFEKAWQLLGNRALPAHRFWGGFESDLSNVEDGVVVAGLAKLFARTKANSSLLTRLATRKPFVVMDEAHQAIAPTYRLLLDILVQGNRGSRLLGLSATPGRTWNDVGSDQELADFFGGQKITLQVPGYDNPVRYLVDQQYLARATYRRLVCRSGVVLTDAERRQVAETLELPESYLARIADSAQRSLLTIVEIEKLASTHQRIIVFAASVRQSELLATVLSARGLRARSVTTKTQKDIRTAIIDDYQRDDGIPFVLCNYGIFTTGFDAPRTSAALIARPTLSLVLYSQMIGRAIRGPRAGGNIEAEIVTVVDPDLPGFDSVESAFSNWEDVWRER
ncbi:DEAD/DEAH box helicase [Paraburkholderia atlantica]|uniref:DEAD/DEAH box helicase n=1 Tax=Paraburkholderia atlantica TaxID=2654982 RepID=UPI0018064E2C|nr:DEAD/DEAH box helicase [Paraburkholderia atlantica]MBB5509529.1 superfamily II DNA or RNA helicase [Paraburkholderia atlantica]